MHRNERQYKGVTARGKDRGVRVESGGYEGKWVECVGE